MDQDISVLQRQQLFHDLSSEQIRKVLRLSQQLIIDAGEIIMREGEIGDSMYIIQEGAVEVIKSLCLEGMDEDASSDRNKVFTRLDAVDHAVFGEIGLLEKSKRTATVRAVTDCVLHEIRKDDFLTLAENDTVLGYRILLNLARIVSARLRKADEETIKLTTALSIILKEM